jgi:hypothetical protein
MIAYVVWELCDVIYVKGQGEKPDVEARRPDAKLQRICERESAFGHNKPSTECRIRQAITNLY